MHSRPGPRALAALLLAAVAAPAAAQQRPLVTEDPESIGAGLVMLEGGFDYVRDQPYPLSGLRGRRWRAPTLGVSVGVSSIAEIQIDGISWQRLEIRERAAGPLSALLKAAGDATQDMDDFVVGAKVRLASESTLRPSVGLRFATKLPNAGNESGLGRDAFEFYNTVLVGKTIRSVRIVGNVGLGILSDPTRGDRQNDLIVYGVSMARAMSAGAEIVAEVTGRANTRRGSPPPGTGDSGEIRAGVRYTFGPIRFDAAAISGLTDLDATAGVTAGFTWVFRGPVTP